MLVDKVVVIAGGAGLLGRQFSAEVARQRGVAIVADIDLTAAERVTEDIRATGGAAEAAGLDITDHASLQRLLAGLSGRYGRIDAVVNSAYPRNPSYGRKVEDVKYADFCENLNLHLGGYFLVAQAFALYFRANGGGNILNIGSIYGVMAPRFDVYSHTSMTMPVEYAVIKAGVIHLTRYLAQYFKADGVRCNSLSPGGIMDGQPVQFLDRYNAFCGSRGMLGSGDLTGALTFLLSDASRYVTGQNLIVDDGYSL